MRAYENWLKSEDNEKWAEAMMKCKHPAGFCGQDGYCHYGDCFKSEDSKYCKECGHRLNEGDIQEGIIGLIHGTKLEQDIEELKDRFGKTGRK